MTRIRKMATWARQLPGRLWRGWRQTDRDERWWLFVAGFFALAVLGNQHRDSQLVYVTLFWVALMVAGIHRRLGDLERDLAKTRTSAALAARALLAIVVRLEKLTREKV